MFWIGRMWKCLFESRKTPKSRFSTLLVKFSPSCSILCRNNPSCKLGPLVLPSFVQRAPNCVVMLHTVPNKSFFVFFLTTLLTTRDVHFIFRPYPFCSVIVHPASQIYSLKIRKITYKIWHPVMSKFPKCYLSENLFLLETIQAKTYIQQFLRLSEQI